MFPLTRSLITMSSIDLTDDDMVRGRGWRCAHSRGCGRVQRFANKNASQKNFYNHGNNLLPFLPIQENIPQDQECSPYWSGFALGLDWDQYGRSHKRETLDLLRTFYCKAISSIIEFYYINLRPQSTSVTSSLAISSPVAYRVLRHRSDSHLLAAAGRNGYGFPDLPPQRLVGSLPGTIE